MLQNNYLFLKMLIEEEGHACMLSHFNHIGLFETVVHQVPLSMGFSRQEYCPPPGDPPNPGTETMSSALQAD